MQFCRHFLLLHDEIGIKERFFVVQNWVYLSKKSILKQNYVICRLERYAKVDCTNCSTDR